MDRTKENLRRIRAYNKSIRDDAEFENKHPRNEDGEFTSGSGATNSPRANRSNNMSLLTDLVNALIGGETEPHDSNIPKTFDMKLETEMSGFASSGEVRNLLKQKGYYTPQVLDKSVLPEDLESAKLCMRGLALVFEKYPELKGLSHGIKMFRGDNKNFANGGIAFCSSPIEGSYIGLNSDLFVNRATIENYYNAGLKDGKFPEGTGPDSVLVHEMAHVLTNHINIQLGEGLDFCDYIFYDCLKLGDKTEAQVQALVSKYGTKSPVEFVAEALSEALTSETPRETSVMVLKEIDAYMKATDRNQYKAKVKRAKEERKP